MALPAGTYPVGGPIVLTGEQPTATAELHEAGARWLGPDGMETIERTGSAGSYVYTWTLKGGGDAEDARELVVLADARSTSTSGQTSLQLPANYTEYENLEIIVGDDANAIDSQRYRTAWLALQQDGDSIELAFLDKDEAGSRQWLTWTPSTRTLAQGAQTSPAIQIKAVRLYDAGGEVGDNSLLPIKARAETAAQKKAWRERLAAGHISAGNTLPALADSNIGDIRVITEDVASGLAFVDIQAATTPLTAAKVGDVIMVLMLREKSWVRVGNVLRTSADPGAPHALVVSPGQIQKGNLTDKFELTLFIAPGLYTGVTKAQVTIGGIEQTIATPEITNSVVVRSIQVPVTTEMATALAALDDNAVLTVVVRLLDASDVQQAEITTELVVAPAVSGSGGADATARAAALANELRLDTVEPLLVDMTEVVDGPEVWANAAAADAQAAYTWNLTSAVARRVFAADPLNPFNPATDITAANFRTSGGNVIWFTARSVNANSIILVRVKRGLSSVQFRTRLGALEHDLQGYTYRGSDADWDYYYGGRNAGSGNLDVAVQRRNTPHHTAYHGDLGGRALEGVATVVAPVLARTQRLRPVSQYQRHVGAQTVYVEWKPVGAVANGAALTVSMGGVPITGITVPTGIAAGDLEGVLLPLAINATNAANLDRAPSTIAGHIEVQITHGGVTDTCWMGTQLEARWRTLTGSSPYTVRATDQEFLIDIETTARQGLHYTKLITRTLLTTTPRQFPVAEQRPDTGTLNWAGFSASLNAAGTEITVVFDHDGGTGAGAVWSLGSVQAR